MLRVEENCLSEISSEILKNSTISTFDFDGNLFDKKKIENTEGYEEYSKRYTQSKQKAEWLIIRMTSYLYCVIIIVVYITLDLK